MAVAKKRSTRGLGSIRKRPNGAWEVRLTRNGRQISRCTKPGATKSEAEAMRREMLKADARSYEPVAEKLSVADAVERFVVDVQGRTSRATHEQYASLLRQHLVSRHATLPIARLRPSHLKTLLAELRRKRKKGEAQPAKLSSRTKQALFIALQQLQKLALAERWVTEPFMDGVPKPRVDRRNQAKVRYWTAEEARAFLEAARQVAPHVYELFVLLLELGPRIGEATGLRWRDVDLEEGTITISGSLDKRGDWGPPKTRSSRRTLYLSDRLLTLLRERRHGSLRTGDSYVFTTSRGAPINQDNLRKREWRQAIESAGVPVRSLHEARHTCASLLLASGEPLLSVRQLLGHEDESTTLRQYGHLLPGVERNTAIKMAKILG